MSDTEQASSSQAASGSSGNLDDTTVKDSLDIASDLLDQALATGSDLMELAKLELHLAFGSVMRMLLLCLVFGLLTILAWLGLSVLVSWLVLEFSGFGPLAALTFLAVQIAGIFGARTAWINCRNHLSLRYTREHLNGLMGGVEHETTSTNR